MSLPLSLLENILHPKQIGFDETYLIELPNKEVVTLGQLIEFWVEGHRRIKSALDIIKENRKVDERKTEEKSKVSSEQEVEVVCSPTVNTPKRTRRNNKSKIEKV